MLAEAVEAEPEITIFEIDAPAGALLATTRVQGHRDKRLYKAVTTGCVAGGVS